MSLLFFGILLVFCFVMFIKFRFFCELILFDFDLILFCGNFILYVFVLFVYGFFFSGLYVGFLLKRKKDYFIFLKSRIG